MKLFTLFIALFLGTFNVNKQSKVLYSYEKGNVEVKDDFLQVKFDLNFYYKGEGDYVEVLVFNDYKNYLGSVTESEFKNNKNEFIKKYNKMIIEKRVDFSNEKASHYLRIENKNGRVYFYYHDQMVYLDFGRKMSDGRYCVGGHDWSLQIKEQYYNVALYANGFLKYAGKVVKDNNQKVIQTKDITSEIMKSEI